MLTSAFLVYVISLSAVITGAGDLAICTNTVTEAAFTPSSFTAFNVTSYVPAFAKSTTLSKSEVSVASSVTLAEISLKKAASDTVSFFG